MVLYHLSLENQNNYIHVTAAPCGEEMIPRSDFPVKPSSPGESPEGLTEEDVDAWKPNSDDEPKVTIDISDKPTLITTLELTDEKTKNVKTITVIVKDEDGNPVVRRILYPLFITILYQNCCCCLASY